MSEADDIEYDTNRLRRRIDSLEAENERLKKALEILADPTRQLEFTPGGYFIFRLKNDDVLQIAQALYPGRWIVNQSVIFGFIEEQKETRKI